MQNLIEVTDAAIAELRRIAKTEGVSTCVRIALSGGGCSGYTVNMDFTKWPADEEFDLVVEQNGVKFYIDEKSAVFIAGAKLDYGGTLLDKGFKWEFPKSTGGCGCGVSFSF